jgi:hypothetical protein
MQCSLEEIARSVFMARGFFFNSTPLNACSLSEHPSANHIASYGACEGLVNNATAGCSSLMARLSGVAFETKLAICVIKDFWII